MSAIVSIRGLRKTYASGFEALKGVDLDIMEGEIIALLGPNGAGKTTTISTICGLVQPTAGTITVGGHDTVRDWRAARRMIGLVPQEITLEAYEKVIDVVRYSRGLFGFPPDEAHIEHILKLLSLWEKRDSRVQALSGGMKRRVLIAKALSHNPRILFLDEPTAGVDVELRKDMWEAVRAMRAAGVTIILTTHYIEEAEAMADRIGIIAKGRVLLVEDKDTLMARMGRKELHVTLSQPLAAIPAALARDGLSLDATGTGLTYVYDNTSERRGIVGLLNDLQAQGIGIADFATRQSSLEEIFVGLVRDLA